MAQRQHRGLPGLSGRTAAIEKVTGTYSPNKTVDRFNVLGTDLGIMWDNGAGQILTAFGDTTGLSRNPGCDGLVGEWRSNVLFRSSDRVLADGMRIDSAPMDGTAQAREIISGLKIPGVEASSIPTSGIAVNGVQYLSYMSVRNWGEGRAVEHELLADCHLLGQRRNVDHSSGNSAPQHRWGSSRGCRPRRR